MNRKIIREFKEPLSASESAYSVPQPSLSTQESRGFNNSSIRHSSISIKRSKLTSLGPLATPQSRLIAFLLDAAIFGFGLGIVWIIWFITLAKKGTTPGHYLMGQVIVDAKSGELFGWKKMVVREVLIKGLLQWILGGFLFMANYIVDGSFIFTSTQRTLHDLMVGSQVIQCSDKTIIKKLKVEEVDGWLNK